MSLTLFHAARWIVIAAGAIAYPVLRITGGHFGGHHFAVLGVAVSLALLPGHPAVADLAFAQATGHVAPVCGRGRVLWGSGACWKRKFQRGSTSFSTPAPMPCWPPCFGVTLGRGRQALCTRFAERSMAAGGGRDPVFAPGHAGVDAAFTGDQPGFRVLFFFASIEIWSIFANFYHFPLVLLMFVVEYGVRLRKLPHQKNHSIMDGVLAFWKTPAARQGTSPDPR